jgi:hypothetical protein
MSTITPVPMFAPDGTVRMVPNNLVETALKSGGQHAVEMIDPQGKRRYVPQSMAHQALAAGGKFAPISDQIGLPGSPWSRFFSSAWTPIAGTVKGLVDWAPTAEEKAKGLTTPYDYAMRLPERVVEGQVDQGKQALEAAKQARQAKNPYERRNAAMLASGHALAAMLPVLGPWAANVGETEGAEIGSGDYAGAAGTAVGNATLALAPKAAEKVLPASIEVGKAGAKSAAAHVSGATPRVIGELAKKTQEFNRRAGLDYDAATDKHLEQSMDAAHETRGREEAHKYAVGSKAEEITDGESADAAKTRTEHEKAVQEAREHNGRVQAKHAAVSKRIQEENDAAASTLDLRKQQETGLGAETKRYYDQEDAAKAKAKSEENSAWAPWRVKMKTATVDGGEIAARLKTVAQGSPEVTRTLRQLQPSAEDAAPDSLYAQDRTAIMKSQGFTGNYFDYPAATRAQIDSIAASSGLEPDPIDFDPQAGKQIPVEQVHRAQSIIDGQIRSGRFEGPLLGEMKQVAKALRAAVTRASAESGALDSLEAAREATRKYQNAFGKERHLPTTQDEIREKQANPEAYKEREDEERLKKTAAYDPSLVDSYRRVKEMRENLNKLPSEDQLRKGQKQAPQPPTVDDLREGYRLKPEPKPPQNLLTSGPPAERAAASIKPPERVLPPDRPAQPALKKINTGDIESAKKDAIAERAEWIRKRGTWVAAWPWLHVLGDIVRGHIGDVGGAALESAATIAGVHAVASALEHPMVVKFLSEATAADIAAVPPELRGQLPAIVRVARAKRVRLSPDLLGLIGATQQPGLPPSHPLRKSSPLQ